MTQRVGECVCVCVSVSERVCMCVCVCVRASLSAKDSLGPEPSILNVNNYKKKGVVGGQGVRVSE